MEAIASRKTKIRPPNGDLSPQERAELRIASVLSQNMQNLEIAHI
jgi:hypothetical protein